MASYKKSPSALKSDPFQGSDPFKEFYWEEPPDFNPKLSRKPWLDIAILILAIGVLSGSLAVIYKKWSEKKDQSPFIFVELKAIDPDGHPVAGAHIKAGKAELGLTDSFGEWRRFMRLEKGSTLSVSISKTGPGPELKATKNLSVPAQPAEEGQLELRANIPLIETSAKRPLTKPQTEVRIPDPTAVIPTSIQITLGAHSGRNRERAILAEKIIPALSALVYSKGLSMAKPADLEISLDPIVVPQGAPGIYELKLSQSAFRSELSFLRNYKHTLNETVADILALVHQQTRAQIIARQKPMGVALDQERLGFWSLSQDTQLLSPQGGLVKLLQGGSYVEALDKSGSICGSYPCLLQKANITHMAPMAGYRRYKLKTTQVLSPSPAALYAGGYPLKQESPLEWSYWAKPGEQLNLSAVKDGRLILKRKILPIDGLSLDLPLIVSGVATKL